MRIALLIFLLALSGPPVAAAGESLLALRVGEARLQAEYACSADERARGLMGRTELPADHGMLFRFDEVRRHCLWMKDTPLPLSAAFMDEQGTIVDILELQPLDRSIRCSSQPARYALEVNQGWFADRGLATGDKVSGIPGVD